MGKHQETSKVQRQTGLSASTSFIDSWLTQSRTRTLLSVTVFLSAFLLFQVQPMLSKAILSRFGGSPTVWTTAMFFFQVVLLVGYCYAHGTSRWLSPRVQSWLHLAVIVLAVALLPMSLLAGRENAGPGFGSDPSSAVMGLLLKMIGLQFFLLSTTAPLVQVWWHRSFANAPYKLYAISNAGSLLALLSYPFVVEPSIGVRQQIVLWTIGFFVVAGCLAVCSLRSGTLDRVESDAGTMGDEVEPPAIRQVLMWLALSTCGSVLLLAMTNHIAQNVAVVPFLWVAPLALYLLSFILCFADASFYRRYLYGSMMIVFFTAAAFVYHFKVLGNLLIILLIHLVALFAGCMVCHGELSRGKPNAKFLTNFYVVVSIGGALGGFLVSFAAPVLFSSYYEYPLVLIACCVLLLWIGARDEQSSLCLLKSSKARQDKRTPLRWLVVAFWCFLFLFCLRTALVNDLVNSVWSRRNFYGVLSVRPWNHEGKRSIQLLHGQISHGIQHLDPETQHEPTLYYARETGLGFAFEMLDERQESKRVGMLGLGVGTIAAYSRKGDVFRAYEINDAVIEIATDPNVFSFWNLLEERGATGEIVVGDARLTLESELRDGQPQNFDILVMDVFSGDGIPAHLLTLSAFEIYVQHLSTGGVLAVHISNRHLDLLPVVHSIAHRLSLQTGFVTTEWSEWAILSSADVIEDLKSKHPDEVKILAKPRVDKVWTDDFSNIFSVLR